MIELKKQIDTMIWSKIQETSSEFYLRRKSRIYWRGKPSDKVNKVKEEQDGIDIDGVGNLKDSPKLMFIDEECVRILK